MTKKELVSAIAEKAGMKKVDAETALNAVIDVITETLVAGEELPIAGLGKFSTKERAARTGRNPQTGETINIPASRAVSFKATKSLKDAVKNA